MFSSEEIAEEVQARLELVIEAMVAKSLERLAKAKPDDIEIAAMVENSTTLRTAIHAYFEHNVATIVGNRLRCGMYNALDMDKAFDAIWTEQFQRALRDRVRGKANEVIDAVIAERLKKLI